MNYWDAFAAGPQGGGTDFARPPMPAPAPAPRAEDPDSSNPWMKLLGQIIGAGAGGPAGAVAGGAALGGSGGGLSLKNLLRGAAAGVGGAQPGMSKLQALAGGFTNAGNVATARRAASMKAAQDAQDRKIKLAELLMGAHSQDLENRLAIRDTVRQEANTQSLIDHRNEEGSLSEIEELAEKARRAAMSHFGDPGAGQNAYDAVIAQYNGRTPDPADPLSDIDKDVADDGSVVYKPADRSDIAKLPSGSLYVDPRNPDQVRRKP